MQNPLAVHSNGLFPSIAKLHGHAANSHAARAAPSVVNRAKSTHPPSDSASTPRNTRRFSPKKAARSVLTGTSSVVAYLFKDIVHSRHGWERMAMHNQGKTKASSVCGTYTRAPS
jgi:hypothetical protein